MEGLATILSTVGVGVFLASAVGLVGLWLYAFYKSGHVGDWVATLAHALLALMLFSPAILCGAGWLVGSVGLVVPVGLVLLSVIACVIYVLSLIAAYILKR